MRCAIVVCGRIGSGKSTAVNYVADRFGYRVVAFGRYIRAVADAKGIPTHRENLQDLGACLFRCRGASGLLHDALKHFGVNSGDSVVFDGVRHPEVLAEIRQSAGTTIAVYLDVDNDERSRRHRSREGFDVSPSDHLVADAHIVEAGICRLIDACDVVLDATRPLLEIQAMLSDTVSRSPGV